MTIHYCNECGSLCDCEKDQENCFICSKCNEAKDKIAAMVIVKALALPDAYVCGCVIYPSSEQHRSLYCRHHSYMLLPSYDGTLEVGDLK